MKDAFFVLIMFIGFSLAGQTPAYLHYNVEDGLPSNMVYCATQDKNGFMWFGTNNGLARFDGQRFKIYGKEDGLPDPEVLSLYEDSHGRLWISCFQKNPCYFKDGVFFTDGNDSLLAKMNIKDMEHRFLEWHDQSMWIFSRDNHFGKICVVTQTECNCHAFVVNRKGKKVEFILPPNLKEFTQELVDFLNSGYGNITHHKKYNFTKRKPSVYPSNIIFSLINDTLVNSFLYQANKIDKIKIQNLEIKEVTSKYFDIPVAANKIWYVDKGVIWLTYPQSNYGIYKINFELNTVERYLNGKQTSRVYKDNENNFWFLTLNEGAYFLPENQTMIYDKSNSPQFRSNDITAIALIDGHEKLIGNATGNIYKFRKGNWELHKYKSRFQESRIRQIMPYAADSWLAVTDNTLYGEAGNEILLINGINMLGNQEVNLISTPKYALVNDGKTYVGGMTGLSIWGDLQKVPKLFNYNERVSAVGIDSENTVWIGGNDGLLSQKDNFQILWGEKFKPLAGRIIDIKPAEKGHLWVVTAENDLVKAAVKNGMITGAEILNKSLSLPIRNIKSLHKSPDNTLWLATNTGVYGIDSLFNIRHFDTIDGLPSSDVNTVMVEQDTLWAATTSGLAKIQLNVQKSNGNFSSYISSIGYELNNKNQQFDLIYSKNKETIIPRSASMIDLQLSGLHFTSANHVTFEYIEEKKLLPIRWLTWDNLSANVSKLITQKNDTTLIKDGHMYFGANIPAGSFKASVTAIAKDGTRSLHSDTKTFVILPYWYETIWFSLFVFGMSAYILWLFIRQYTRAKRFQRAASELQLAAIKAQVNPHFVGNSINAIQQFFYPPDSIAASQYIATFTSLLRQTMHLSEVPFISYDKELSFITDYLKMVKLRFGERFEYQINEENKIPGDTLFPAMILQPILENATIHGFAPEGKSTLNINFELKGNKLACTITDNGIGIEKSKKFKKKQSRKRVSKGIQLLQEKINVMNKMYGLDLKIEYLDLSSLNKNVSGTRVHLSYSPDKITT